MNKQRIELKIVIETPHSLRDEANQNMDVRIGRRRFTTDRRCIDGRIVSVIATDLRDTQAQEMKVAKDYATASNREKDLAEMLADEEHNVCAKYSIPKHVNIIPLCNIAMVEGPGCDWRRVGDTAWFIDAAVHPEATDGRWEHLKEGDQDAPA